MSSFVALRCPDAEVSYLTAKKLDPKEVHAYLGLARLYRSYSMYRNGLWRVADRPRDRSLTISRYKGHGWTCFREKKDWRHWKSYLGEPHPDDEEETKWMTEYLGFPESDRGQARSTPAGWSAKWSKPRRS